MKDATGDRLDQVGTRYTAVNPLAGRPIEGQWEVTQAEPNRVLEMTGTAPGGGRAVSRAVFADADGATDATIELDYELPGGFLGQFANRLYVERALQRDIRHSTENVKALCEEADTPLVEVRAVAIAGELGLTAPESLVDSGSAAFCAAPIQSGPRVLAR